jgi:hypothetical protein
MEESFGEMWVTEADTREDMAAAGKKKCAASQAASLEGVLVI